MVRKIIFVLFLLSMLILFAIPAFAATEEEAPYKQEVHDFLYGLLPEDVREALQNENCYDSDIQKLDLEDAVPILVLPRSPYWYSDGTNTFREKLQENSSNPDWYWMLGRDNVGVVVKSKSNSENLTVNYYYSAFYLNADVQTIYPYVQELSDMISEWEREGVPNGLTNVYVLNTSDLFICCEYGSEVSMRGTSSAKKELVDFEFNEQLFDYYLADRIALIEKQHEYNVLFYGGDQFNGIYYGIVNMPKTHGKVVKQYYEIDALLQEHYNAIAEAKRQKQTLALVIGCSGGALLVGAAAGAATATAVIIRRKKRKSLAAACDDGAAHVEGENL